jgi:hypothetical protein
MKLLIVLLLAAVAAASQKRYDGYRMIDVGPLQNKQELDILLSLVDDDERVRQVILLSDEILKTAPATIAVAPFAVKRVQDTLTENSIKFSVIENDLQSTFDATMKENEESMSRLRDVAGKFDPTLFDHDAYLRYADQVAWVNSAVASSPIATSFSLGSSYEGRNIVGVAINAGTNLPGIWIDANIHAREWVTSATALYIIDQILTSNSADAIYLRNNFRWYFVPNLNPDGYEFCWTGDRLWRKTRSANSGSPCVGTDPNRNWDANWCGEGASSSPCSDTYCGSRAFSEPETAAARDYLVSIRAHTDIFISIHCYSQLWLVPWGGYSFKPADYSELKRVADAAVNAIRGVNGRIFEAGTPPDLLYVASGGSFDWAKETNGMTYAYSPELRPATAAQGGFEIPPSNIVPSGAETFAAIVAVAREARAKQQV